MPWHGGGRAQGLLRSCAQPLPIFRPSEGADSKATSRTRSPSGRRPELKLHFRYLVFVVSLWIDTCPSCFDAGHHA